MQDVRVAIAELERGMENRNFKRTFQARGICSHEQTQALRLTSPCISSILGEPAAALHPSL